MVNFFEYLLFKPDEVKACPWCGDKPGFVVESCGSSREGLYWDLILRCKRCDNHGPRPRFKIMGQLIGERNAFILKGRDELKQAIDAWNRRADDEQL